MKEAKKTNSFTRILFFFMPALFIAFPSLAAIEIYAETMPENYPFKIALYATLGAVFFLVLPYFIISDLEQKNRDDIRYYEYRRLKPKRIAVGRVCDRIDLNLFIELDFAIYYEWNQQQKGFGKELLEVYIKLAKGNGPLCRVETTRHSLSENWQALLKEKILGHITTKHKVSDLVNKLTGLIDRLGTEIPRSKRNCIREDRRVFLSAEWIPSHLFMPSELWDFVTDYHPADRWERHFREE